MKKLVLLLWVAASSAAAQLDEQRTFNGERFRPAVDGQAFLDVESALVPEHLKLNTSAWLWYSQDSLNLQRRLEDGSVARVQTLIGPRVTMSFLGNLGLYENFAIGLELPVIAFQSRGALSRDDPTASLVKSNLQTQGIGDVRLVPRATLLRAKEHSIDLGVGLGITLPTAALLNSAFAADPAYMGEHTPTLHPELYLSRSFSNVRLAANLGYRIRGSSRFLDLSLGNELTYRVGAAYELDRVLEVPLELSAAFSGQSIAFNNVNVNPLELLFGARYEVQEGLDVGGGVGFGVAQGYATPDFRVFGNVRWAPREDPVVVVKKPRAPEVNDDLDDDGIKNIDDRCPETPEDLDDFEDADGCPDPDNDGDGIADVADACPLVPGVELRNGCPVTDRDGDGLEDEADECPDAAEDKDGFEDEDGCPDADNDKDGVVDAADRCPLIAEDADGFEDDDGCPDDDNDRDGFKDADDRCPDEPETINGNDDDDGCPDEGKTKVIIKRDRIEILEKVYFNTAKARIKEVSFNLLQQVATVLKTNGQITKMRIEGHTDSQGRDTYNQDLSARRATAVRAFLIKAGVTEARLEAQGFGEDQPIDTNDTAAGRENNRRVEFKIVEIDGVAVTATETVESATEVIEVESNPQ